VPATTSSRQRALLALLLLVPVPSLAVLVNLVLFPGPFGMAVWGLSKVWILTLPAVWLLRVEGQRPRVPRPHGAGTWVGLASGAAFGAVVLAADAVLLGRWIDPAPLRELVAELALDTRGRFLAMALYTCLLNSLLEEYVWRWFVTAQLERLAARPLAVLASAAAFTLHHVIVLQSQFTDWRLTVLGSLAVFAAGALWSALYLRYRSVWSPWLSHLLVDVAVFLVGARIVFGS
jgi:hypothetical protein